MKRTIRILGKIWLSAAGIFLIWCAISFQGSNIPSDTWATDDSVRVEKNDRVIAFLPRVSRNTVILFLPGAWVDPWAYAPLMRELALERYPAYILKMPWRLSSLGHDSISRFFDPPKDSTRYVLAGHSLGGKAAAQFVKENPGKVSGLILLGTSHPRDFDLSRADIPVLKISGTCDGVASMDQVKRNLPNLPAATRLVWIEGGNHSQFGYYGFQLGDREAEISRQDQQRIVREEILRFLQENGL